MLASVVLGAWLACASVEPAAQQPAASQQELALEVRRLVRQLSSPQLAQREAAEEALLKLGPGVLELLPASQDPEVKVRLERVRQRLLKAVAESVLQPSRVSISGESVPLGKVLEAIRQQTGNKLVDWRERFGQQVTDPALKLRLEDAPFWQALDEVLDQATLAVYPFGTSDAIHLVARGQRQLPRRGRADYCGPFRIEAVAVTAQRDLRDPSGDLLRLTLEVAWEPRLRPILVKQRMADLKATDDTGQPLALQDPLAELEVPIPPQGSAANLLVSFRLPPRSTGSIARLEGKLWALVPGQAEAFRFGDLANARGAQQRIAGATVTLERVQRSDQLWQVLIRLRLDEPGQAFESHRGWVFANEAFLEGPNGQRLLPESFEMTSRQPNEVGFVYNFAPEQPLEKYVFVYRSPTRVLPLTVQYTLKDIPLP
jgi:hypothetical protein